MTTLYKRTATLLLSLILASNLAFAAAAPTTASSASSQLTTKADELPTVDPHDALSIFDATVAIVAKDFYDPNLRGLPWTNMVAQVRATLKPHSQEDDLKQGLNQLLGELHASHTRFLSDSDQEYWALKSMFSGRVDGAPLRQVGAWFKRRGAKWFVSRVFRGSPAERAGLMRGDEIVSVDGNTLEPVNSFTRLRPQAKAKLIYKRVPWDKPREVLIETVHESFQETMLRDLKRSITIIPVGTKKIGYVALSGGTHEEFRALLTLAARDFQGKADAMVLDLRDGFGGAGLAFLEPFMTTGTQAQKVKPIYQKPLVILVDDGTSSGKEWLAWFLKKHERGPLVGEKTAGAFLTGRAYEIVPQRYLLYLAVGDTKALGAELEGLGLSPDLLVEDSLMYAAGDDPQLAKALVTAAK